MRPAPPAGADTVRLEYSPAQGEGGGRSHCPVSEAHWRDMNSEGTCCSTQYDVMMTSCLFIVYYIIINYLLEELC